MPLPDAETGRFVRERAGNRCEYCLVQQRYYPDFAFHIEHIVAKQHGGSDDIDNLALACHQTDQLTRLFNPRADVWDEQFRPDEDGHIVGLTAIGRTTAYVLGMNADVRIRIRQEILRLAED